MEFPPDLFVCEEGHLDSEEGRKMKKIDCFYLFSLLRVRLFYSIEEGKKVQYESNTIQREEVGMRRSREKNH